MRTLLGPSLILAFASVGAGPSHAQTAAVGASGCPSRTFEASAFSRYDPDSAADLIAHIPGFTPAFGSAERGLGGQRSNLQIDGVTLELKAGSPSELLGAIPIGEVVRIELLSGGCVTSADGHDQMLNIVRAARTRQVRELNLGYASEGDRGESRNGAARYEAENAFGALVLNGEASALVNSTPSMVSRQGETIAGLRSESDKERWSARASGALGDFARVQLSAERSALMSTSAPSASSDVGQARSQADGRSENARYSLEFSGERATQLEWRTLLFASSAQTASRAIFSGREFVSQSEIRSQQSEQALRADLNWAPGAGVRLGLSADAALTEADNQLALLIDGIASPLPGAQSSVQEERVGASLTLSAPLAQRLMLESGLRLDRSTLTTQAARSDAESLSPRLSLNLELDASSNLRVSAARQSAQLDFGHFLARTSLQDEEVSLGAVVLRPETQSFGDLAYTRRFWDDGLLELRARHTRFDNPIAFLPVSDLAEAPANTSPAELTALEASLNAPLDKAGLAGALLTARVSHAQSHTRDPLTGETRPISGEQAQHWSMGLRQSLIDGDLVMTATIGAGLDIESFGVRQISEMESDINWSASAEWRPVSDWELSLHLTGANCTRSTTRVFNAPRRALAAPAFVQESESETSIGLSAAAEWRLNADVRLRLSATAPSQAQTQVSTQALGTEAREVSVIDADHPARVGVALRWRV